MAVGGNRLTLSVSDSGAALKKSVSCPKMWPFGWLQNPPFFGGGGGGGCKEIKEFLGGK